MSYFPMILCALVQSPCCSSALIVDEMNEREVHVIVLHFLCSTLLPCRPLLELILELIQTQMTQKPMLRAEVYARALRASQNRKEDSE
jgi:hypothetical protein